MQEILGSMSMGTLAVIVLCAVLGMWAFALYSLHKVRTSTREMVAHEDGWVRLHLGRGGVPGQEQNRAGQWFTGAMMANTLAVIGEALVITTTFTTVFVSLGATGLILGLGFALAGIIVSSTLGHDLLSYLGLNRFQATAPADIVREWARIESDRINYITQRILQRVLPRVSQDNEALARTRTNAIRHALSLRRLQLPTSMILGHATASQTTSTGNMDEQDDAVLEEARERQEALRKRLNHLRAMSLLYIVWAVAYAGLTITGVHADLMNRATQKSQAAYQDALSEYYSSPLFSLQGGASQKQKPDPADFTPDAKESSNGYLQGAGIWLALFVLQSVFGLFIGKHQSTYEEASVDVERSRYWNMVAEREAQRFEQGMADAEAKLAAPGISQQPAPALVQQSARASGAYAAGTSAANSRGSWNEPPTSVAAQRDSTPEPGAVSPLEPAASAPAASGGFANGNGQPHPGPGGIPGSFIRLPRRGTEGRWLT